MAKDNFITEELRKEADRVCSLYERKRAAILPVLSLVQEKYGYIPVEAEGEVADYFGIPLSDVRELLSFYSLFHTNPIGEYHFQVCRNLSCALMKGDEILAYLIERLGIQPGETTSDGRFTLSTVECLGACEMAPMMQWNEQYVGPLTKEKIGEILKSCEKDRKQGGEPSIAPLQAGAKS